MKFQKNTGKEELEFCLIYSRGLSAIYVKELGIIISFRSTRIKRGNKIKDVGRLLNKLKKIGVFRVEKTSIMRNILGNRKFKIKQEDIIDLLDCQNYEVKS